MYSLPQDFVKGELKIGCGGTVVDWYNFAREVCAEILEYDSEPIGGENVIVEIDESKFGKRKYHKGRRVDGCWVFGGIERESKKCFFTIVEKRNAETLVPLIKKYIKPKTNIISDCWAAYAGLEQQGYNHLTVNHSKEFVNSETGAHTQTIESTWHQLKLHLPRKGTQKQLYNGYFMEYVIRKKYLNDSADKFLTFLDLVSRVYNVNSDNENVENVDPNTADNSLPLFSDSD